MQEFELVDLKELPKRKQEKALWNLWSIYAKNVKDATLFHEFKGTLKKDNVNCIVRRGELYGVVSYRLNKSELFVQEIWARPSRDFLRDYKVTVGRFLHDSLQKMARKKGLRFKKTSFSGAGVRFGKRLKNPPKKPKLRRRK